MKKTPQRQIGSSTLLCALILFAAVLIFGGRAMAQNILINPGMETGDFTGWTTYSAETWNYAVADTNGGLHSYPKPLPANPDPAHSGEYSLFLFGDYQSGNQYDGMYQDAIAAPGDTYTADVWAFSFGDDYFAQTGQNLAWVEVTFRDATKAQILALYRTQVITSNANYAFPTGVWVDLPVTNQYDPTTYAITNTVTNVVAPPGTADVRYQIVFNQVNWQGGSSFWDDMNLDFVSGPVPPVVSSFAPIGATLCTNTNFTCTASSASALITNVQLTVKTHGLTGATTTTTVGLSSPALTVTGLGTASVGISYTLTTNLNYTITVNATDNNGTTGSGFANFDTLSPALVIEASDFNFSNGQFIDTPWNGGLALYAGQVGVQGVDENKNSANGNQGDKSYYRTADPVIVGNAAPAAGGSLVEQKFLVAAANGDTLDQEVEVGYNGVGDWLDYTRTYGSGGSAPAGSYNVWCYLATDGAGINTAMYQIAGDPTSSDQVSNYVGTIGTQSFSDNGWNTYVYVPLVDQFGNLVSINLDGVQTLRSQIVGNPNLGFYMLMPVTPILTPNLKYAYPDGVHPFEPTNSFTFTIGAANGASIDSSGIQLILNNVDVTSQLTLTGATNSWTGTIPVLYNRVYAAVINATNTAGLSSQIVINFDTFSQANYQWEAEDYDFSTNTNTSGITSGLYIDNPVPSGDTTLDGNWLETNSYYGYPEGIFSASTGEGSFGEPGVDFNYAGVSGQSTQYRPEDAVGTQICGDYLRQKFIDAQNKYSDANIGDFNIGWYSAGYWLNYTRDWPTNSYYVWGRMAGGAGAFSGTTLSILTTGYGTATQTTNVLGTFADPNAAGWAAWHWVQMMNNGAPAVISLGGKATLKMTSGSGLNVNFLMLVPAPVPPTLAPAAQAGQASVTFPTQSGFSYILRYTPTLTNPSWSSVGSPIAGDNTAKSFALPQVGFYQVMVQ
jgi:hypothetical protein